MSDGPSLDSFYRSRTQVAEPQHVLRCAPAAIAPIESVQLEHAVDGVQLGRLDQFGVRDGDCKQRASELLLPEGEKVLQRREIRKHTVVLPDASLQQPVTIRTAIDDFRCCQSVAQDLLSEILGNRIFLDRANLQPK